MNTKIDQAFVKAFKDAAFGLPIAYENDSYSPTSGTAYAELLMMPNDVTPLALKGTDQTDGVFRVVLRYPANSGAVAIKQMADTIASVFKIGARVCYSGTCATVVGQQRQPGVAEAGWFKIVLTIRYRATLRRAT